MCFCSVSMTVSTASSRETANLMRRVQMMLHSVQKSNDNINAVHKRRFAQ